MEDTGFQQKNLKSEKYIEPGQTHYHNGDERGNNQ